MTKCPEAPHCPGGEFCEGDFGYESYPADDWIVPDTDEWYGSDN